MPHGLIPRFIVETHDKLPKQRCAWANGVILEIDKCRVLVRADRKNRRVDVFLDGVPAWCRGALAVVRDRFARVHRLYPELNPRELVPLPDRPDLDVSYLHLVTLEGLGQKAFVPEGASQMYRVSDLLNKVEHYRTLPTPPGRDRSDPIFPPRGDDPSERLSIEVFFSYAHKDKEYREELAEHLEPLKDEGVISVWHDREILPGQEWTNEISDHLESARIVLFLVSSSFVASRYCREIEMARALKRHEDREAVVIPIIVRSCDWTKSPIAKLQALPTGAKAVTLWSDRDEAWTDVAQGIRKAAEALKSKPG